MATAEAQFMSVGDGDNGRQIACLLNHGRSESQCGVMWLPGFKSEMTSTKASALADWAAQHGHAMTRLDYSGHGQSSGDFNDGTIGRWLEEVEAVFGQLTTGPQVVVGSSMGGYLALLLLRSLAHRRPKTAERLKALILIAPAWDMTERLMWPRFTEAIRRQITETGVYLRPSHYGDGPYPITKRLLDDGRNHLIGPTKFDPGRPVHILHGLQDPDVPWEHSLDLVAHLEGDWATVTAIPDGDHRLSRPEDIALLVSVVAEYCAMASR